MPEVSRIGQTAAALAREDVRVRPSDGEQGTTWRVQAPDARRAGTALQVGVWATRTAGNRG
jgi:hypothetical protein